MPTTAVLARALDAFDVFLVGRSDDGTLWFSRDDGLPVDDTVVWSDADPAEVTVAQAEAGASIVWRARPTLVEPAHAAAATPPGAEAEADDQPEVDDSTADDDWTPEDAVIGGGEEPEESEDPIEAEVVADEQLRLVEEVEARTDELEARVTELILDSVTEDRFAAMGVEHRGSPLTITASARTALSRVADDAGVLAALRVRLANMGEPPADLTERLSAVVERLDKLEAELADLVERSVEAADLDAVLSEMAGSAEDEATVDETQPPG